jgi:hypothetical protein
MIPAMVLVMLLLVACGIAWYENHGEIFKDEYQTNDSPIIYTTSSVQAGDYADFIMYIKCASNQDEIHKLIIAFNVPKTWTDAKDAIVTWENNEDLGTQRKLSLIPEGTSPKNKPGLSWNEALLNNFGGQNPNVLDDTQWFTFIADDQWPIYNGGNAFTLFVKVRIRVKTGPDNLRAKIGFFANYDGDGLSTDGDRWKVMWGDCFEVTDGEGDVIDFCDYHFSLATPGQATQNDIITFKYIGDYYTNALMDESNIYLNATAYTVEGNIYTINEISEKTRMKKESEWGAIYSLTFWSEALFNVPANETITSIRYYFTNADGSKYVSDYDEQNKLTPSGDPNPAILVPGRPINPFIYNFVCK